MSLKSKSSCELTYRLFPSLICPNPNHFLDRRDKDLAVANFSSLRRFKNSLYDLGRHLIRCQDLDFDFGKEVHCVLGSAIEFRVTFLPTKAFDLAYGHTVIPADVSLCFTSSSLNGL